MTERIIPDHLPISLDGERTLIGVADKYWDELSRYWNSATQITYWKDYVELLAPHFADQPLKHYTDVKDFESAIEAIRINGTRRSKKKACGSNSGGEDTREYSSSTLRHLRYLLRLTVKVGAKHGECTDVLWGTSYEEDENEDPGTFVIKERTQLRKSFTPSQELDIADLIFTNPLENGHLIAVLNMLVWGLRNHEAAALKWGDLQTMPGEPDKHVIVIHRSMIRDTHKVKDYGKTYNFYRILTVPKLVYGFYMVRKKHIQEQIKAGRIILTGKIKSIDQMPIACDGMNWMVHPSSSQVTAAARQLFKDIKLSEDQLRYMTAEVESNELLRSVCKDDDPTAYTMRRHVATILGVLGLDLKQIQYWMGHKIRDQTYVRNDFANTDMLLELYKKMSKREVVNEINASDEIELEDHYYQENISRLKIRVPCNGGKLRIWMTPNEFHVPSTVIIKQAEDGPHYDLDGCYFQHQSRAKSPEQINVLQDYYDSFCRARERKKKKEEKEKDE